MSCQCQCSAGATGKVEVIDRIIEKYQGQEGCLIPVLHEV